MGITFGGKPPHLGSVTITGYRHKTNKIEHGRFGTFYSLQTFGIPSEVKKTIHFDNALILPNIRTTSQEDAIYFIFGANSPERRSVDIDPGESGLLYADIILLAWAVTHGVDGIVYGDDEFVDYKFDRGLIE